jgi:hypothetical protein
MPTLWGSPAAHESFLTRHLPFHVHAKSLISSDLQAPAAR